MGFPGNVSLVLMGYPNAKTEIWVLTLNLDWSRKSFILCYFYPTILDLAKNVYLGFEILVHWRRKKNFI